eukprot:Gregarina_sp_Poly_1__9811@NODE_628_length_7065_cov_56_119891_g481_i0_p2_GENE_NODE_628_length_7065_cov_56_119891_g481_i0NODE_628_length_7065_cov_56_119891_g481_i0_p2_ORF_typecomplete_len423_score51_50FliG_N/PF14842_6/0_067_NODE_628_length_7065_cov_56_119891_g481_i012672535
MTTVPAINVGFRERANTEDITTTPSLRTSAEIVRERDVRSVQDLSAITNEISMLDAVDAEIEERVAEEFECYTAEKKEIMSNECSVSSRSSRSASSLESSEELKSVVETRHRIRTRSRIRQRGSEWKQPVPGFTKTRLDSTAGEGAILVGEEEKWMHLDYDDVVSAEEVELVRRTVWKPKGHFPNFNTLEQRTDYRHAWDVGYMGTRVIRRRNSGDAFGFVTGANGAFWDAEFDGTDIERFLKVRPALGNELRRQRVLDKLEVMTGFQIQNRSAIIFPASALMTAEFHRLIGTIRIHDLGNVNPPVKESSITFDLVKGNFIDAMVYCLWQMQIHLEIRRIRLQRIMNVISLQQKSMERRRDASRARAAAAHGYTSEPHVKAVVRMEDLSEPAPLLFDPVPTRARMSKSLARPVIRRPLRRSA